MAKKIAGLMACVFFIGLIAGIIVINNWIQNQVSEIDQKPIVVQKPIEKVESIKKKVSSGAVTCKIRLAPERTFEYYIFYQEGDEIARHKSDKVGNRIYDQVGEIPRGQISFTNESDQTFGTANYSNNLRHGLTRTRYPKGALKKAAYYDYGKIITSKEYYEDGILKMEEDYTDARDYDDGREVGVGKMYTRDGQVKFEWYLVKSNPIGYHKSYNRKGTITGEVYFDKYGNIMPPKKDVSVRMVTQPVGP